MKKAIKRIAQKSNRKLQEMMGGMEVNLILPIAELMRETQWHVEQLAGAAGMKIIQHIIADDARQLAGERRYARDGKDGQLWGRETGWVGFAGRKVSVERPRIRSRQTGREMKLPNYERLQQEPRLGQAMMDQMTLGLSTRNYEHAIQALCDGYGIKKSSVSRHFITASRRELEDLLSRKLSDLKIGAVFLDGVHRGGQCVIVALGVSRDGRKHCLGLWQGATENSATCESLLKDLIDRGLDSKQRYVFIVDGAKALSSAIQKKFPGSPLQRCQLHKRRNVKEHLPEVHQADVERRLKAAYAMFSYKDAKAALHRVMDHHVRPKRRLLFEHLGPNNEEVNTPAGHCANPGHSVESMWFVLHQARRRNDSQLIKRAAEVIRWMLEFGWDKEKGGIPHCLDADGGKCWWPHPEKKLWWPHGEALYALLIAHELTREPWCMEWYWKVHDWSFEHFPDRENGEWHQKLDKDGRVITEVVALPVKDPFHLPRNVMLALDVLNRLAT